MVLDHTLAEASARLPGHRQCGRAGVSRGESCGLRFVSARRQPCRRAFSLAELMVALGVLGIGLLILAAAFPIALNLTRQSVELSTSRLVFEEAIQRLQDNITWVELERYLNPTVGAWDNLTRLGDNDSDNRSDIYILDFDGFTEMPGTPDFFSNMSNAGCAYSQDDGYGWLAAVRRLDNSTTTKCYQFFVFVAREPTGFLGEAGGVMTPRPVFKTFADVTAVAGNRVGLGSLTADEMVQRGQYILGNDGRVYKAVQVVPNTTNTAAAVQCDRAVLMASGGSPPAKATYLVPRAGDKLTRRNPAIWVYQTILSY